MVKKMIQIAVYFLAVASLSTAKHVRFRRQFPCDHFLRITYPDYFRHCDDDCMYSDWGDWEVVEGSTRSVNKSLCKSGEMYCEQRKKLVIGSNCNELTETRQICIPDAVDRLILYLKLGGSGQDYSVIGPLQEQPLEKRQIPIRLFCPRYDNLPRDNVEVCSDYAYRPREKRSASYVSETLQNVESEQPNLQELDLDSDDHVMPFSHKEHGHRFRRQVISPEVCARSKDDFVQHVLFVLDSSGSIARDDYERMKIAVAILTTYFCNKVKFALMTYSSIFRQEFCFNCFDNNNFGRIRAANAIKEAPYTELYTFIGEAARCICDEFLKPECGIKEPSCLDVVFITDAKSNGRLDVCNEAFNCLHSKIGINTYAIGIGNYNKTQLDCIADGNGRRRHSTFEFQNFSEFEEAISEVGLRLLFGGDPLSCAALYGQAPTPTQIPVGKNPSD